jgi:actin-like protein 6B
VNTDLEVKPDNNVTSKWTTDWFLAKSNMTFSDNKYYVDTTYINVPRSNMEIQTFMKDGMIDNWELFEKVRFELCLSLTFRFLTGTV